MAVGHAKKKYKGIAHGKKNDVKKIEIGKNSVY